MRYAKRLLAYTLSVPMVLSLAACGGGNRSGGENSTTAAAAAVETTASAGGETVTEAETTAAAGGETAVETETTASAGGETAAEAETTSAAGEETAAEAETTSAAGGETVTEAETTASAGGETAAEAETTASAGGETAAEAETTSAAGGETVTESETTSAGGETVTEAETTVSETEAEKPTYDYKDPSIFESKSGIRQAPEAKISSLTDDSRYSFRVKPVGNYGVPEGACTDGEYAYVILLNSAAYTDASGAYRSECMIVKIDMEKWEIVAQSESLPLDHGNDITYNSKTGMLMAANVFDNPRRITMVDPETLTVTDTVDIDHKIDGLAYNESRDCYVAGITGTNDLAVMDADFKTLEILHGVDTGFTRQGIDSDEDYIYYLHSGNNCIVCYNWDGEYAGAYFIPDKYMETEGLFHVGDDFYVSFYIKGRNGGTIWAADLDRSLLK